MKDAVYNMLAVLLAAFPRTIVCFLIGAAIFFFFYLLVGLFTHFDKFLIIIIILAFMWTIGSWACAILGF